MDDRVRVVELFAGVGGFRLGLESASDRYKTIWANQWEPGRKNQAAFQCYQAHYGNSDSENVNADIEAVKNQVPEHDLLVGGFPCQDYSVASTGAKGIEGKKGVLWWSIYDIVSEHRPSFVLLENVDRLLRSPGTQRGRDFAIILRCFADEGYNVEWRVVNAADYGYQQSRRRTFIFACRKNVPFAGRYENGASEVIVNDGFFAHAFPVKGLLGKIGALDVSDELFSTIKDVSDGFKGDFHRSGVLIGKMAFTADVVPEIPENVTNLGDILQKDVDEKYYIPDAGMEKWKYMKGAKKVERKSRDGFTYLYSEGSIPFPDRLDRPSRTMLTSEGSANRSSHLVEDPWTHRYRRITPVECERLNGFPDGWTDTGMSERQRYFTMGNALVVQLVERMGRTMAESCFEKEERE